MSFYGPDRSSLFGSDAAVMLLSVCVQLLCSGGVQSLGSAGGGVGRQQNVPDSFLWKTLSDQHWTVLLLLYVFTPRSHVKVFTPLRVLFLYCLFFCSDCSRVSLYTDGCCSG